MELIAQSIVNIPVLLAKEKGTVHFYEDVKVPFFDELCPLL
jgi:hypothetical protein